MRNGLDILNNVWTNWRVEDGGQTVSRSAGLAIWADDAHSRTVNHDGQDPSLPEPVVVEGDVVVVNCSEESWDCFLAS